MINTYILKNKNGFELEISTLGATILSLNIPNKNNQLTNVVVGLNESSNYLSETYLQNNLYLGATIGRYAGRLSDKEIVIASEKYPIYQKNGIHLHGGKTGFDKQYWKLESLQEEDTPYITLSYISKDLEEGYPGNLKTYVTYTLTDDNELKISYKATTDKTTHVNLTNHSYFNLDGENSILDHELFIDSDFYLDTDKNLIPSGKKNPVQNNRFNYKSKKQIGDQEFKGLDNTYVLNSNRLKAELVSKKSGIGMKVFTNQPSIVVYTPTSFKNLRFKNDVNYSNFPAICFETQHFPDSPKNKHFPSTVLEPNETYINETTFKFYTISE